MAVRLEPLVALACLAAACACPSGEHDGDSALPAVCLAASCGDGVCQPAEDCGSCAADCACAAAAPGTRAIAPGAFVTRQGNRLILDGQPFRFAGPNIYWLGLDSYRGTSVPSRFRQEDVLETAVRMGATVVRSHTLGISTGHPLSYEPALGQFNEDALEAADRAVERAGQLGLRLIIPLTDNYHYYHGGRYDFVGWRGRSDGDDFYRDPVIIADFKDYVSHLLQHVNRHTGIPYEDDAAILAWELGNELDADGGDAVLTPWTAELAGYLKSLDASHLVADGHASRLHDPAALAIGAVDLYTYHFYSCSTDAGVIHDAAHAVDAAGKVFYVGEYDWTLGNPAYLGELLKAIESEPACAGDLYWNLWSHADDFGYATGDALSLYAPGVDGGRQQRIAALGRHAFAITGRDVPRPEPPPAPLLTLIAAGGAGLAWRGSVGAAAYTIESAPASMGPWRTVCANCVTDLELPWTPPAEDVDPWVRVTPVDCGGAPGTASAPTLIRP